MKESLSDTYFIRPEHPMNAYSRLKRLLQQRYLSVSELQSRMQRQGFHVNVKSLYRLSDELYPVDRLDMRVAGAICQACEVSFSEWIVFEPPPKERARSEASPSRRITLSENEGIIIPVRCGVATSPAPLKGSVK